MHYENWQKHALLENLWNKLYVTILYVDDCDSRKCPGAIGAKLDVKNLTGLVCHQSSTGGRIVGIIQVKISSIKAP